MSTRYLNVSNVPPLMEVMIAENNTEGFEINFSFGIFSTDWKLVLAVTGGLPWLLVHGLPSCECE